jgi:hypothetical protein
MKNKVPQLTTIPNPINEAVLSFMMLMSDARVDVVAERVDAL